MKAAYLKAPYEFEVREKVLREIGDGEVLVKVKACSVCGHDLILARYAASERQPFGHEIAGVVEKTGRSVENVKAGDSVVLESGTFDRFSDLSRNGKADLDNKGPNFWLKGEDTMGFAEYIVVPCETCVRFTGIDFVKASATEPLGVALDLFKTADVRLGDDVLVMGLGPIGLMAARLAVLAGARNVYGTEFRKNRARVELAKKWGVKEVVEPSELKEFSFPRGGLDKILITAPPKVISQAVELAAVGGIIAFLGIEYGEGGVVSIDSNPFHVKKLQLRSSNASPAMYFPECLELIKRNAVDTGELATHRFALGEIGEKIREFVEDGTSGIKAVMVTD